MTNILCVSLYDNGGQMQQLTNALNKYTNHNCRHLNFEKTFLNYDVDIAANDYSIDELKEILNDRDFFIFSEMIPPQIQGMGIEHKLNRGNIIQRCFGRQTRYNLDSYRKIWNSLFMTYTSGGFDPTIHPYIGFTAYHIPNIYDFDKFPKINRSKNGTIKICQSPTKKKLKSESPVANALAELEKEYDIEPVIIKRKSWDESLNIKSTCHITIDQFKLGTYASSAIESMYFQHPVLSRISPFIRSMHPDLPIINTYEDTLYDTLEQLIIKDDINEIGERSKQYAIQEHGAKQNIIKWSHLIEWVESGFY